MSALGRLWAKVRGIDPKSGLTRRGRRLALKRFEASPAGRKLATDLEREYAREMTERLIGAEHAWRPARGINAQPEDRP